MATDIEKVRVLIPDLEAIYEGTTLFEDSEIQIYLEVAGNSVLRAAGFAVLAIANSEALISKVIRTQDLQTDGAKVAEALGKQADRLFARADVEDNLSNGYFIDIIDYSDGWATADPELTEWNWSYLR